MIDAVVHDGRDPGDVVQELLEDPLPVLGVQHLGVELHPGEAALDVLERRHRRAGRRRGDVEPRRRRRHRVAVRHPHGHARRAGRRRATAFSAVTVSGVRPNSTARCARPCRPAPAPWPGTRSRSRTSGRRPSNSAGVDLRRAFGVHATRGRRTGSPPRAGAASDLGDRHRRRHDLAVDVGLAHPARDQLGVLGAEVDDEDGRRRRRPSSGGGFGGDLAHLARPYRRPTRNSVWPSLPSHRLPWPDVRALPLTDPGTPDLRVGGAVPVVGREGPVAQPARRHVVRHRSG